MSATNKKKLSGKALGSKKGAEPKKANTQDTTLNRKAL